MYFRHNLSKQNPNNWILHQILVKKPHLDHNKKHSFLNIITMNITSYCNQPFNADCSKMVIFIKLEIIEIIDLTKYCFTSL